MPCLSHRDVATNPRLAGEHMLACYLDLLLIQYFSNSTKISTNIETAMLSGRRKHIRYTATNSQELNHSKVYAFAVFQWPRVVPEMQTKSKHQ